MVRTSNPCLSSTAMTWAQWLKRVFKIDVETCRVCGGTARVIACIEDPVVIKKILKHLEKKEPTRAALLLPNITDHRTASTWGIPVVQSLLLLTTTQRLVRAP